MAYPDRPLPLTHPHRKDTLVLHSTNPLRIPHFDLRFRDSYDGT